MVSMPVNLRWTLIVASFLLIIFIIYSAIKTKLNIRYAIVWFTFSFFVLLLGLFPEIALWLKQVIGIESLTNFLFLVMISILFFISYYCYIKMSKMSEEIKRLTYMVAELKKEKEQ